MSQIGIINSGGPTPPGTVLFLQGDQGGQVGPDGSGVIHTITDNAANNSGSSVLILGNPGTNTLTLNVSDVNNNTLVGFDAGNLTLSGSQNASLGALSLNSLTSGSFNSAFGYSTLRQVTSGANNTSVGNSSGLLISTASGNTSVGAGSLSSHTTGLGHNTAVGFDSLANVVTGHDNTALGYQAAQNYTGAESNNIIIGNLGTIADAGVIRIGTSGTHINNFQAGISGVVVANTNMVTINTATGQLGSQAVPSPVGTVTTLTGDRGGAVSPTAGNINVITGVGTDNSGNTVFFSGSGSTLTFNVTDASNNTCIGKRAVGQAGNNNITLGYFAGSNISDVAGDNNVAIGVNSLGVFTASNNIAIGNSVLTGTLSTSFASNFNTIVGVNAFSGGNGYGSYNVGIGYNVGNTGSGSHTASSNIYINSTNNSAGENNCLRIGSGTGSGNQQLATAFISGINGNTLGGTPLMVTIDSATDQLGVQAIPSGGSVTIDGDTGSATGSTITFNGLTNAGSTVQFSATGSTVSLLTTDSNFQTIIGQGAGATAFGSNNTALGYQALSSGFPGNDNTAIGYNAGIAAAGQQATYVGSGAGQNDTNNNNTFIGYLSGNLVVNGAANVGVGATSLQSAVNDSHCVAVGQNALFTLNGSSDQNTALGFSAGNGTGTTTGSFNTFLGASTGLNYAGAESSNILIGYNVPGTVSESNTLRIGAGTGTSAGQLNAAFVSGIQGITVTGTAVLVSASDQLGIAVSSERFKENIKPLESTKVLELQPVSFNYKVGDDRSPQTGLIAEQVYDIMPELVVLDKQGLPQSIKYHELGTLLLVEVKKLREEVEMLKCKIQKI